MIACIGGDWGRCVGPCRTYRYTGEGTGQHVPAEAIVGREGFVAREEDGQRRLRCMEHEWMYPGAHSTDTDHHGEEHDGERCIGMQTMRSPLGSLQDGRQSCSDRVMNNGSARTYSYSSPGTCSGIAMELSELSDTAVGAENEKKSGRGEEGEAAREGGSNGESVGERSMACRWRENFVVVKRREGVRTGRAVVILRRQQPDTGRPTGKGRDKMKIRRCREESRELSPTRRRPTTRNQSSRRRWSQERRLRERGRGQEKKYWG